MVSPQLELFRQALPKRPYCTDDLASGLQIQVPAVTRHDLGQRSLDAREPIRMVVLRALDAYGVAVPKEAIVDRRKIR